VRAGRDPAPAIVTDDSAWRGAAGRPGFRHGRFGRGGPVARRPGVSSLTIRQGADGGERGGWGWHAGGVRRSIDDQPLTADGGAVAISEGDGGGQGARPAELAARRPPRRRAGRVNAPLASAGPRSIVE